MSKRGLKELDARTRKVEFNEKNLYSTRSNEPFDFKALLEDCNQMNVTL